MSFDYIISTVTLIIAGAIFGYCVVMAQKSKRLKQILDSQIKQASYQFELGKAELAQLQNLRQITDKFLTQGKLQMQKHFELKNEEYNQREKLIDDKNRLVAHNITIIDSAREALRQENVKLAKQKKLIEQLIKTNFQTLDKNEMFLYNIKESTINTLNDYKLIRELVNKALNIDYAYDETEQLHSVLGGIEMKIDDLESSFYENFKLTSNEYINAKGALGNSDCSIN